MLRLSGALVVCLAMTSSCGMFFAEASVERLCRQQTVRIESVDGVERQHVVLTPAFDVSAEVPKDDHLTLTLTLNQAQLTAAAGSTLPYVSHATLSLIAPPNMGLQTVQLVDYHADSDAPQTSLSAHCTPVEALQYAQSGQLEGRLTLDVESPPAPVDTTIEVCGALTARYDL